MAKSLNGWTAIEDGNSKDLRTITIPGTKQKIKVQTEVAPLMAAYLADWQREMPDRMKIANGPVAGWAYRKSRFTSGLSNHSSGTAVDVLWTTELPADGKPHMNKNEKDILDKILGRYVTGDGHRVLANGEWWNPPHCDGMHTEISQSWDRGCKRNTTIEDVREVIKKLHIDNNGNRPLGAWDWEVPDYAAIVDSKNRGIASPAVWRLAARLYDLKFFGGIPIRGKQKYPIVAVKNWQIANGMNPTGEYTQEMHSKIFANK